MRSSSSMVSSCCHMPTKLRHTCRRSASQSIGSSLACAYRSLGRSSGSDRAFPRRPRVRPGRDRRPGPRRQDPARLDGLRRIYGDKVATKVTVPTETITEGPQRIDGVTYDFKRFVDGESDLQLAALLLDQKVLMAFDLVFSPNQHARLAAWGKVTRSFERAPQSAR